MSCCTRSAETHSSSSCMTPIDELADPARDLVAIFGAEPRQRHLREIGAVLVGESNVVAAHRDAKARRDADLAPLLAVGDDDATVVVDHHREARAIAKQPAR